MTPRGRVVAALNHRRPDRLPRYDIIFPSFVDQWRQSKRQPADRSIYDDYSLDIPRVLANQAGPYWRQARTEDTGGDVYHVHDSWGRLCRHRRSAMHFEVLETVITDQTDLDKVDFGDPNDMVETKQDRCDLDRLLDDPRFAPVSGVMGLFQACAWLRGDEPFLMDLGEDSVFGQTLVDKISRFLTGLGERMLARTQTWDTGIWVYDDFSASRGPLISPATFEKYFLAPYKLMFARWKSQGATQIVLHHDVMSEACYPILDMFLEAGLTGVQGVYPTTGLTLPTFKAKYGKRLSVIGGMCNTQTLPFGTKRDIERQASEITEVAREGGVIIGSHSIEGYIPVQHYDWYHSILEKIEAHW